MSINELAVQWLPLIVALLFIGFRLWRFYWFSSRLAQQITEDVSITNEPPPPSTVLVVNQLVEKGFHRLGEIQFGLPNAQKPLSKKWVLVNESSAVLAEVGTILNSSPMVFLTTQFPDGSQIETGFPFGSSINNTDYRAHTIGTSLDEAYQHHLEQIREWQLNHGAPDNIHDMNGVLQMDKMRQVVYGKRKLKALLWQGHAPVIALMAAFLVGWYGARWATLAGAPSFVPYLILIGIPSVPILWIYWKLHTQQRISGKTA